MLMLIKGKPKYISFNDNSANIKKRAHIIEIKIKIMKQKNEIQKEKIALKKLVLKRDIMKNKENINNNKD